MIYLFFRCRRTSVADGSTVIVFVFFAFVSFFFFHCCFGFDRGAVLSLIWSMFPLVLDCRWFAASVAVVT